MRSGVLIAALLALIGFGCVLLWVRWPSDRNQQNQLFFAFLQFSATIILLIVTFLYVRVTQVQLEDQNRAPHIKVTYHTIHQDPFRIHFELLIANPSVKATSIGIDSVQVGSNDAASVFFQGMKKRMTIPARELAKAQIDAIFDSTVISPGVRKQAVLIFDEIFRGTLPPVHYSL
jgi:hypothetical protein